MMGNFSQPVVPITATNGSGFGGGNGDALWIFALLVLFGGGGFGGGFGNRGGAVPEVSGYQLGELAGKVSTKDDIYAVQNSTNQGFAGLNNAITQQTAQIGNGISALGVDLANRLFSISQEISGCCCTIQRMVAEGFGAQSLERCQATSSILRNDDGNTQKVLDAICGLSRQISDGEKQALRDRVNLLEQKLICGHSCY